LKETDASVTSFFINKNNFYLLPGCWSFFPYLPDDPRMVVHERGHVPSTVVTSEGPFGQFTPLGLDRPTTAPRVDAEERQGRDSDQRSYVFTVFNRWGEESAPSPPSEPMVIADGDPAQVTFDAGPEPCMVALYRSATGSRTGGEERREAQTLYLFVGAVPAVGTSLFVDLVRMKDLGRELLTKEVMPPPPMRAMTHLEGTGVFAGVWGNQVFFSENYEPYNWPLEHVLTLPSRTVNIVSVDAKVFVTTASRAYVIDGAPACEPRKGRVVLDTDHPFPDIGRGPGAATATPFGMVFATAEGLMLLNHDATVKLITADWFNGQAWRKLRPETIRMTYWRGRVVFVTDVAAYMLEVDPELYKDYQPGALTEISDRPTALYRSNDDELLMLQDGKITQWDAGSQLRPYRWTSATMLFAGRVTPTRAKLGIDGAATLTLISERGAEYSTKITDETPARLKRLGRGLEWKVRLEGLGEVSYLQLGTALTTLMGET
jgi:hypothetical protein